MPHVAENVGPGWDVVLGKLLTPLGDLSEQPIDQ
jgi:hypothetical protein